MATKNKGRGKSRNTSGARSRNTGAGTRRRRNEHDENPTGTSTALIAFAAAAAAATVVTIIMVNRRNMVIDACKTIGGLGNLGGGTTDPQFPTEPGFPDFPMPNPRQMNPQQTYVAPAMGYGQPRYPYGGA